MYTVLDLRQSQRTMVAKDATRIVFASNRSIVDQLDAAESHCGDCAVLLDFEEIETVDSAELSALVCFALHLRWRETTVSLCNIGTPLAEIFAITRFGSWDSE